MVFRLTFRQNIGIFLPALGQHGVGKGCIICKATFKDGVALTSPYPLPSSCRLQRTNEYVEQGNRRMKDSLIREAKADNLSKDVIYEFQLIEERDRILNQKPRNWNDLEANGFTIGLTNQDIGLLSDFEDPDVSLADRKALLEENGEMICEMYLKLIGKVSNLAVKKYFLARVDKILSEDIGCAKIFNTCKDPYGPFLKIFRVPPSTAQRENEMMAMFVCRILSKLFPALEKWYLQSMQETKQGTLKLQQTIDQPLNDFIMKLTELSRGKNSLIPLKALKDTLKQERAHEPFIRDSGVKMLASLLQPGETQEQVMYLVGFCVWILSFNVKMLRQIDLSDAEEKTSGLVKNLVTVVRQVQREKVIRICFASFRNMLMSEELKGRMVGLGLLDIIKTLNQTEDKELKEDTKSLPKSSSSLTDYYVTMLNAKSWSISTFEKYTTEVLSGVLQKSAVHSETFWRKNNAMFEKESYRHIRKLVELLDSKEAETLEMACYDLGEFARFHPDGRNLVTKMGAKSKIMSLMGHRNEQIAKQALLCIQKLMVSNWEFLSK
eukprot:jgi/Bigna1/86300/estExt_fgenesh1_pg.C_90228